MSNLAELERKPVQSPRPRYTGWVGVCGQDTGRFNEFAISLGNLERPPGWQVHGALNYSETRARNWLAENFEGDWLWFIDDDHCFAPDILTRLLAHDVGIVAPLCFQRKAPFQPVALTSLEPREHWPGTSGKAAYGLQEVAATGTAGMLIHRQVFDALDRPYFFHDDGRDKSETSDILFCKAAREAGFDIYVDTSVTLTHLNVCGVTPVWEDGRCTRGLSVASEEIARF